MCEKYPTQTKAEQMSEELDDERQFLDEVIQ